MQNLRIYKTPTKLQIFTNMRIKLSQNANPISNIHMSNFKSNYLIYFF